MASVTADLEFFKCDLCGTYFHKDIFCDHRRDCTGTDSNAMKKSECKLLQEQLSRETFNLFNSNNAHDAREVENSLVDVWRETNINDKLSHNVSSNHANSISVKKLTADEEKRRDAEVRRRVANRYQAKQDALFAQKLSNKKQQELLEFLNSE